MGNFPNISDDTSFSPINSVGQLRKRLIEILSLPTTCDNLLVDLIELTIKHYKEKR
jgi:hypothetical protein